MKNWTGTAVTEIAFSHSWEQYLSSYHIDTTSDNWFLKTIAQAFDALPAEDVAVLTNYLSHALQEGLQQRKRHTPTSVLLLYDALLEPYFQRKFSIVIIKNILVSLIEKINDRATSFTPQENAPLVVESRIIVQPEIAHIKLVEPIIVSTNQDTSIIDITAEGQKLSFSETADNEPETGFEENNAWKLGNKYGQKLGLSKTEIDWLNKFWDPSNAFIAVEQCCIETIRLYLTCLKGLDIYFTSKQSNLQEQIDKYAEGMVAQNNAAVSDAYAINYFREQAEANIYLTLFKKAENCVRNIYRHKRKINDSFTYNGLAMSFERRFGAMASEIIRQNQTSINAPHAFTELQLNKMNTARWKDFFDEIISGLTKDNIEECTAKVDALATVNEQNPSVEYIHYEACKAFTGVSNVTAVKFYLKYIYADLHSEEINNKQLTKSIQKSLFQSAEQLADFEAIVNDLVTGKNLKECLQRTENLYAKRRKKLELDRSSIEQIQLQHQATVDRLNELLQDEEEVEINIYPTVTETSAPIEKPAAATDTISTDITILGLNLNADQKGLLLLFGQYNFQVEAEAVNTYAKSKGLFRNALIERINDCCYPELDDVLIKETGDGYEVNEFYYNKIINIC